MRPFVMCLLLVTAGVVASAQTNKKKLLFVSYANPKEAVPELRQKINDAVYELATRLFVNTQRFEIVDRLNALTLELERKYQTTEAFLNVEIAKQGRMKAAQVITVARVTDVDAPCVTDSKTKKKSCTASITVEFKEISIETGQILAAYQLQGVCENNGGIPFKIQVPGENKQDVIVEIPAPATQSAAVKIALRKTEKDLQKWISNNFPIEISISDKLSYDEKMVIGIGGDDVGLTPQHKMRIAKLEKIEGKTLKSTVFPVKVSDGVQRELTKFKITCSKREWEDFVSSFKRDPKSYVITEVEPE